MVVLQEVVFFFFFFFQAEDGIRDGHVTGVQTCALPIYPPIHLRDRIRGCEIGHIWGVSRRGSSSRFIGSEDGWRRTRRGLTGLPRRRSGSGFAGTRCWRPSASRLSSASTSCCSAPAATTR